jgi:hypothetical protein
MLSSTDLATLEKIDCVLQVIQSCQIVSCYLVTAPVSSSVLGSSSMNFSNLERPKFRFSFTTLQTADVFGMTKHKLQYLMTAFNA